MSNRMNVTGKMTASLMKSKQQLDLRRKANFRKGIRQYWILYIIFIPILAYYIVYRYYPMFLQFVLSIKEYRIADGIWGSQFVGLNNIRKMIYHADFSVILRNTVRISLLRLGLGFVPPIILAIFLFDIRSRAVRRISQAILYIPHFFSWVIIYGIVFAFFSSDGMFNNIIKVFGGEPINFLMGERYFLPLLIGSDLWKEIGWGTIIYLAALTNINTELFEVAKLDGAGPVQRIIHITLPGIANVVVFLLILSIGNILKNSGAEQILLFYSPATFRVGDVIDTWVYRQGITKMQYSMAASVSFFQSLFGLLLILLANQVSKRISEVAIW